MRTVAALSGAALVAVMTAGYAHAEPECYGYTAFDDTVVCVVRVDPPDVAIVTAAHVPVAPICAGPLGCTDPLDIAVPYPVVEDGGTVVLFHHGVCYYVAGRDTHTVNASTPEGCP